MKLEAEIERLKVRAAERRSTPLPEMMSESVGLQAADIPIDSMVLV